MISENAVILVYRYRSCSLLFLRQSRDGDSFSALLSIFKTSTFVSLPRGICQSFQLALFPSRFVLFFSFPLSINFPVLLRLENEWWDSCGLKGNRSERVDTLEGRKELVSTAFKNGGRFRVMKLEPASMLFASNFFIYGIPKPYNV